METAGWLTRTRNEKVILEAARRLVNLNFVLLKADSQWGPRRRMALEQGFEFSASDLHFGSNSDSFKHVQLNMG